ncbi:uncharacterized protein [Antedon mediterranea]|uniref:uncharacterized protein n=1 Tax=Antedon mediterranea TaxID=105859 RepID=UPI003AF6A207
MIPFQYGDTPLHLYLRSTAPTLEIVTCLIQHGAPVALQNKSGDTPLHSYLRSGYATLSIVTCLIQHGAPVELQNKDGNTLVSLLESNRRIERERKTEILNFLEDLPSTVDEQFQTQFQKPTNDKQITKLRKPESDIPSDIAARELEYQEAYKEALKGGSVAVNLGMLKVIGQEGVGKTCLINACLGKIFEEEHKVTDGIAVIRTVSTTWTEAKADSGNPLKQYTKFVTDKLREKKTINIDMKPPTDDVEDDDGIVVDYNKDDNNDDYKNNDNNDYTNDSSYTATKAIPFDTDQQLDKDVIKELEEKKEDPLEETFNIWDHGGQLIYHGIHRMFMTLQALYIVVFDLSVDLNDPAVYIDSNGVSILLYILCITKSFISYLLVRWQERGITTRKGTNCHPTFLD